MVTPFPCMYQAFLSEKIQFLRNVELFKKLLPTNIEKIAQVMELKTYNLGDKLIAQGDAGDAFYMMQSGDAKTCLRILIAIVVQFFFCRASNNHSNPEYKNRI